LKIAILASVLVLGRHLHAPSVYFDQQLQRFLRLAGTILIPSAEPARDARGDAGT
jgi:hypothetical protein